MARVQYQDQAWGEVGGVVVATDANVAVYEDEARTILADIYSLRTGATTPGNPYVAPKGIIQFFVEPGQRQWVRIWDTEVPARFDERIVEWSAVSDSDNPGVILADASVGSAEVVNASLTTGDLAFDVATQVELDAAKADYEKAFSTWRPLARWNATSINKGAGTYGMPGFRLATIGSMAVIGDAIYIDPAILAVAPRVARLRLRASIQTPALAPNINYTYSLRQLTDALGTLGAAVTGSQPAAIAASSGNVLTDPATRDVSFDAPAAGWYQAAVNLGSGEPAASDPQRHYVELLYRAT